MSDLWKAALIFCVVWLCAGCSFFDRPGRVVLVPEDELRLTLGDISPDGRYLAYYRGGNSTYIADLVTGTHRQAPDECGVVWLDSDIIYCYRRSFIMMSDFEIVIHPESIEGNTSGWAKLISKTSIVYKLDDEDWSLVILEASDGKNYIIREMPEDFPLPDDATINTITTRKDEVNTPVTSPDGNYYYIHTYSHSLVIYRSENDKIVREIEIPRECSSWVAGWTYDSSGVIYRTDVKGFGWSECASPIYKLSIPN